MRAKMIINGQELGLTDFEGSSLADLIAHFKLKPQGVAVEMNASIPDRERWDSILLKESDRIELIRFVGGG